MPRKIVPFNSHSENTTNETHQATLFQSLELQPLPNVTTTGIMNNQKNSRGGVQRILVQNTTSATELETKLFEAERVPSHLKYNLTHSEDNPKESNEKNTDWISDIGTISQQNDSKKEWTLDLHEQFKGTNDKDNWSAQINVLKEGDIVSSEKHWECDIPDLKFSNNEEWISEIKTMEINQNENWNFDLKSVDPKQTDNQGWSCHLPGLLTEASQNPKNWTTELNDVNIIDYIDRNEWENKLPNVYHKNEKEWKSDISQIKERTKLDNWKGVVDGEFYKGNDVWNTELKCVKERKKPDSWQAKLDNSEYGNEKQRVWKFDLSDVKNKERNFEKEWRAKSDLTIIRNEHKHKDWSCSKSKDTDNIHHNDKSSHWKAKIKDEMKQKENKDWPVIIKDLDLKEKSESKSWKYNLNDCKLLKNPTMKASIKNNFKLGNNSWSVDSPDFLYSEGGCIIL